MRVLMACLQFPTDPGRSYLTTELALALVGAGHEVEVLLVDWNGAPAPAEGASQIWNGIRVVRCTPRLVRGLGALVRHASKFLLTAFHAGRVARRRFDLDRFDIFIAWAPTLTIAPIVDLARRARIARRLLFIWDFFPDHYVEIGRIPRGAPQWVARFLEQRLMAQFTTILCTLPQNADYLRRRFKVRPDQTVKVTPIWSDLAPVPGVDRALVRSRHGLPHDRPIAVFGGQLVEGRGFELMLAAAEIRRDPDAPVFLFVGEGRLAPMLRAKASDNVLWRPAMARDAYLQLLGACDVGLVATTPGVTSFSIPSKTLDYLRAGLPVAAALEAGNDFAALLERYGVGRAVRFGDARGFLEAVEVLAAAPPIATAARTCLEEVFDVRRTVAAIVES